MSEDLTFAVPVRYSSINHVLQLAVNSELNDSDDKIKTLTGKRKSLTSYG